MPGKSGSKNRSSCNLKSTRRMHAYEANSLSCALEAIRDGKLGLSAASRLHNIPKSTLRSRLHSKRPFCPASGGAEPALAPHQEKDIVLWLIARQAMGATVGWSELAEVVRTTANSSNKDAATSKAEHKNYSTFGDKLPTHGWLLRFKRRHSNVPVLRTKQESWFAPQHFSLKLMDEWIEKLYLCLQKNNVNLFDLFEHSQNERLFYLSSLNFVTEKSLKYTKQFEVIINSQTLSHCKLHQMLICYSAAGTYLRPVLSCDTGMDSLFVHNLMSSPVFDAIINEAGMNSVLFLSWLKLFIKHLKGSIARPVVLLLDRALASIGMEAFQLAEDSGVLLFCFPLHSECEQPGKFGVVSKIREALMNYDENTDAMQSKLLTKVEEVWQLHCTPENAIASFKETGLLPLRERYSEVLEQIAKPRQLEETSGLDRTTKTSADFIKGMEQALKVIEQKCVAKEYLPLYREFYSKGSIPNCDPVFNIWKTLNREIDNLKKSPTLPHLMPDTLIDDECIASALSCSGGTNPVPRISPADASRRETDAVCAPTRCSVPISDRYRREFNFDAMPALNLEQHALEIMEKYKSLTTNTVLEQLVIDDVTDFGGDSSVGNNNQNGAYNS